MKTRLFLSIKSLKHTLALVFFVILMSSNTFGQILWSSSGGSAWLTGSNWTGSAVPTNAQIAQFGANPTAATGVGINFANVTNAGTQSNGSRIEEVGAVEVTSARAAAFIIGNSSGTAGATGTFRPMGTAVNGVSNCILRNNSTQSFTIQNIQSGGNQTMAVALGNATNNVVNVDNTGNIVISSNISGSSKKLSVNCSNSGDLRLSGTNTFDGGINIDGSTSGGRLRIDAVASLPTTGTIAIATGGRMTLNLAGTYGSASQSLTFNPNQTTNPSLDILSNAAVTYQGPVAINADTRIETTGATGSLTFSGNLSGSGKLIKQAAGTLVLSGTGSTATGGTQIGNGTLTVNSGSKLGTGDLNLFQTSTNNTALNLNENVTVGNLTSNFTATTGTQTQIITVASAKKLTVTQTVDGTYGKGAVGTLTSTITGAGSFAKSGAAKLTLSGANTYTGDTEINAGKLNVTGTLTSDIYVFSNGTLTGTGSTSKSILVAGTISPGDIGTVGTISTTASGTLTLDNDSHYVVDITKIPSQGTAGTDWDKLTIASTASVGSMNIDLNGTISNFDNTAFYSWTIATMTPGSPPPPAILTVTNGLTNPTTGTFSATFNGSNITLNYTPAPTITSFTPTSAGATQTVVITGTNFTGASEVTFGGTNATSYTVDSATQISATLASGTTGSVAVTTVGGTGTKSGFTFVPAPTITSFSPTSAGATNSVVITGTNFSGTGFTTTAVTFGGTNATSFTVDSATQITATIASGTSGLVAVTTVGGTGTKTGFTFVPAPTISSFTPTSAGATQTVVITGTNFSGTGFTTTAVTFGGTNPTSFTVDSATQITATVASGTSGSVSVTTVGGTASLAGFTFIPNTQIQDSFDNTTVALLTTPIYVDTVAGAEAYTYKVVNGGFSYEKERTGANMGYFNFSQIPGAALGTTYTVTVKVKINGVYGVYGTARTISTGAALATSKLNTASCGITLTSIAQKLYADVVAGAAGYKFEVTGEGDTRYYETTGNVFNLTQLSGGATSGGVTYTIRVAVKNSSNVYGSFGASCDVVTPTAKIRTIQCGSTLASLSTPIASDIITGATNYTFEIIGGGATREYESSSYILKFNRVSGYATLNTTYAIRVKVKVNGTYGVYGASCNVTTPLTREGELSEEIEDFTVASYPNPFTGTFQLDLKSASNNEVNVMVYEMLGKQIENRTFNALEVYNQEFGANYAAGVYNVLVAQNGTIKTVRVIKN